MKITRARTEYEMEIKVTLKFDEQEVIEALDYISGRTKYQTYQEILDDVLGYVSNYDFGVNDISNDDRFSLLEELRTTYRTYCSAHILGILEGK